MEKGWDYVYKAQHDHHPNDSAANMLNKNIKLPKIFKRIPRELYYRDDNIEDDFDLQV